MTILSIRFFIFVFFLLFFYYLLPQKYQWALLLLASFLFYLLAGTPFTSLFLFFSIVSTYWGGIFIGTNNKHKNLSFALTVLSNLGILIVLKYTDFIFSSLGFSLASSKFSFILPLGLSFYTFQVIGYITDVYRGLIPPEKNIGKYALFCCFFPQIISGPIGRFGELAPSLFSCKAYNIDNLKSGFIRLLYGYFKKIVISERLSIFVDAVFGNYASYNSASIFVGAVFYALQLYTDFSGYMDIVLGISKMLGISMAENFHSPFFSSTISEFWRRWHITLGSFLRDYLFFPLLKGKPFLWLSEKVKKKYGKKAGKKIPTYLAMFLLWFSVGLWHGPDWKYVFGVGIFQWVCIVFGELCSPLSKNIRTFKIYPLFCQVRTFLLICFSFLFFRSDSFQDALFMLQRCFSFSKGQSALSIYAPWEGIALLLSIGILFYLEIIGQKRDIWQQYLKKPAAIQYCIYYFLIFFIVIFGVYGLGFDSSAFTYANF